MTSKKASSENDQRMASQRAQSDSVSQRLEECGLNPVYWSGVLRAALDITSLDQVGEIGKEAADKLMRCKQSESELEALHRFIASTKRISTAETVTVSQRLEECGLNPVYWSGVLRAALDISSLDQVGEIGKEAVDKLMRYKQSESELEALNQFFASSRISNIGFIEKHMDNSKRKYDRVKLLVNELFDLNEARELRVENDVKKKADELCQVLNIPKDNCLKDFNKEAVATVIVSLSADLPRLDEFLSTKSDLSIAQALDEASDGLALRGLLPTEESGYQRCPEKLLSATCRPRISIPQNCQETIEVVHSSKKNFQDFNKTLKMSGFNRAAKMKAGSSGGGSAADQERDEFDEGTVEDVHYSKTMCTFLPTMKVDLRETKSCSLSTRALEELKGIAKLVADGTDEQLIKSKCIEFLKRFGSYFHLDYILGGIFKLAVVYSNSCVVGLPHRSIVDMVNDIYDAVLSSSFLGLLCPHSIEGFLNEEKMKKLGLGNTFDPSVLSKVSIQVERCGGSGEVASIPLWIASLGLGSDICSVVESDAPQLCAIWDLIYKINAKEIQHPQKIAVQLLQVSQSQFIASPGSPISQPLGSHREEVEAILISNQSGTVIPAEASLPSPEAGSPDTRALESDQKEPVASPTSKPLGLGIPGEASLSSQEAGSPLTPTLEYCKKEMPTNLMLNTPPGTKDISTEQSTSSPASNPQIATPVKHDPCRELLSLLDLERYYPQKISLKRVVSITEGREERDKLALTDIPWTILRKLLMINYEGRNTAWEGTLSVHGNQEDPSDEADVLSNSLADLHDHDDLPGNAIPHPTDIFLATFSCCDLMLRQVLLEKMTMCRLSVPLVMPGLLGSEPTLCKWALRSLVLEYSRSNKSMPVDETQPGPMVEFALVDCPMKVVSFVKIGEIPISKSQLVNSVLSAQSHHTFFNKESCRLGTSARSISNGMIEAAWYIPNKRDKELFDDVNMFLNLRGDAANFPSQVRLISTISSVVIVFVDIKDLNSESSVSAIRTLYQSHQQFVLVLTGTAPDANLCVQSYGEKVGEEIRSATTKTIITTNKGKKQKNLIEIVHAIRQNLSVLLKEGSTKTIDELSNLVMQCNDDISIDENDEKCQQGKAMADKVTCYIENIPVAEIKRKQLPIQQLYPEWSRLLKERNRSKCKDHKTTFSDERETLLQDMRKLREDQCKKGLNPMLQRFISTLIELIDKPTTLQFFLQWLKLCFDKLSREHLPELRSRYHECWAKFNAAKGKSAHQELSELKKVMDDAEKKLAEASCGLEHLFREVGQLYEASKESKHASYQIVDKLPEVAARLLLLGHPIELMDGDAANVPMTWVTAVLASLAALTGECRSSAEHAQTRSNRVFVLSVLGIQSSGKSTLLNTMFGLRFAVSAGRCTRGVFAQLVEVDSSKTGLPFDYILVVDTEGLKAPELSQNMYEHDNELATLAIGLGDVVILNIKGENVSEMQDVLQIAVHAFLRMKRVELLQTCVFIHQNVSATNANEKMAHGRQKLLDNLDEMTEQAAEQEELIDIHSFNQIINIDTDKCVWYFSDLWQGDPPMAPVNPGYSEYVEKVRKSLLFDYKKNDFLSVQHLSTRINDLWQGILADDFVFSFRNTLAVKAYSALEDMYHKVTWEIESSVNKWFSDTAQNKLERCETEDSLNEATVDLIKDLDAKMADLIPTQKLKLEEFFEKDNLKQITIQWKEGKIISMMSLAENLVVKTRDDINQKRDHLRFELRNQEKQEDLDKQILANASKLAEKTASELAGKTEGKAQIDAMLPEQFNKMWDEWVTSLAPPKEREETPIQAELERAIHNVLFQQGKLVKNQLGDNSLTTPLGSSSLRGTFKIQNDDTSKLKEHGKPNPFGRLYNFVTGTRSEDQPLYLTESFFAMIETYLNNLTSQDRTFNHFDATEVVKTVTDFVDDHNTKHKHTYKFTFSPSYKVRLVVHVCRRAFQQFTRMREEYNAKHSASAKLKLMKNAAFNLFKNKVLNCSIDRAAADLFCDRLAEVIKLKVKRKIAWEIFENTYNSYSQKKYHFIVAILEDLACHDGFDDDWGTFLRHPETYALEWITRVINKRCFSPENKDKPDSYASIASVLTGGVVYGIRNSVKVASADTRQRKGSTTSKIDKWMKTFCNEAEKYLAVREKQMKPVCDHGVESIDNFEKLVLKQLDETSKQIIKDLQEETKDKAVKWEGPTPYKLVMDKLWGCSATCPFCQEPCQWTDADHCKGRNKMAHRCIQHRAKGLGGTYWTRNHSLVIDTCSYAVQSDNTFICHSKMELDTCKGLPVNEDGNHYHPYREYKTYHPNWDIAPSPTMESSKFWMWAMATYKKELAKLYGRKQANIPKSWTEITKEEALKSLRGSLG